MTAILHVCMTCRAGQPVPEGSEVPGRGLCAALKAMGAPTGVTIREVECLSACDRGCSIALTKPGGWSYVYGGLATHDAPEILRGAAAYSAAPAGLIPWRDRPLIFRKQSLARIPPMES